MKYYKNSCGAVAKLLRTQTQVILMFGYRTLFFDDDIEANEYLRLNGFY